MVTTYYLKFSEIKYQVLIFLYFIFIYINLYQKKVIEEILNM